MIPSLARAAFKGIFSASACPPWISTAGEFFFVGVAAGWWRDAPLPFFPKVFFLKGVKSLVSELFIPERLQACFLEVRISAGLANGNGDWWVSKAGPALLSFCFVTLNLRIADESPV